MQKHLDTSRKQMLKVETDKFLITYRGVPESCDGINAMVTPLKGLYPDRNLNARTIRQSVIRNMLNEQKLSLEYVQMYAGHRWLIATEKYRSKDINEQRALINKWHPLK
jgi:integrase/recombinase XerD